MALQHSPSHRHQLPSWPSTGKAVRHKISQEPSCSSVVMNQYVSPNHIAFLLH